MQRNSFDNILSVHVSFTRKYSDGNQTYSKEPTLGDWTTAVLPFKMVPEGYEYAVQTMGRASPFLKPGFNLVIPFLQEYRPVSVQRISARIPLQVSHNDI